jgi:hypothetical protein
LGRQLQIYDTGEQLHVRRSTVGMVSEPIFTRATLIFLRPLPLTGDMLGGQCAEGTNCGSKDWRG